MPTDAWNPDQYQRFADERSQPFYDLMGLVEPRPGMRVVDLGCGTGELTRVLHEHLSALSTLGIDTSGSMLARASRHAGGGLGFRQADIATWRPEGQLDLVFSNAALHWVDDHHRLLPQVAGWMAPGGQLAVQVPANDDHIAYQLAHAMALEEPYAAALGGYVRETPVLAPEEYATLLHRLGFRPHHVRLQVYGHTLPGAEQVVEWVKGTLLTDYQKRLPPQLYAYFLEEYRDRVVSSLPSGPYYYPFKRILMWGRKPAT